MLATSAITGATSATIRIFGLQSSSSAAEPSQLSVWRFTRRPERWITELLVGPVLRAASRATVLPAQPELRVGVPTVLPAQPEGVVRCQIPETKI